MDELKKLRMEFRTDVEMVAISQGQLAKSVDRIGERLEQQGREIAEQGRRIDQNAQLLDATHRQTAGLAREFSKGSRETEGRIRLMGERLERILLIAEHEYTTKTTVEALDERVRELTERVERLEKDRPPAA